MARPRLLPETIGGSRAQIFCARGSKTHAAHTSSGSFDRCGSDSVADQPIHPDAGDDQIDFERRRGDRGSAVAAERVRAVQLVFTYPHRQLRASRATARFTGAARGLFADATVRRTTRRGRARAITLIAALTD